MKNLLIILTILLFFTACRDKEEEMRIAARFKKFNEMMEKFKEVQLPTKRPPQIYGYYSSGCIDGAITLPLSEKGYQVLRISSRRYYGHPQLINFIKTFAARVYSAGLKNILVGDMAMPRGGPMYYDHYSHQTGIDVDFAYKRITDNEKKVLTIHEMDNMKDPSVMTKDLSALDPGKWDGKNIKVLQIAAEMDAVERIFVNPVIARVICSQIDDPLKAKNKWVKKIRPWFGHHDHYHVRLKCPKNNPQCVPQEEITEIICGSKELDEWFTEEANEKQRAYLKNQLNKKEDVPELPEKCQDLIKNIQINKD